MGTLRTTRLGLELIKSFEGLELKSYKCPAGIWTIGYGHTTAAGGLRVGPGMTITKNQAEQILADDIDKFEDNVERALGKHIDSLTEEQFDALVSLVFNIGIGAFKKSSVLARIKAGNLDGVPAAIMMWNKAKIKGKSQVVAGLTRRRRAECALWRQDTEDASTYKTMAYGAMPQKVETVANEKSMATSTTGGAAVIVGAGGAVEVFKQGGAMLEQVQAVKDQVDGIGFSLLWDVFVQRVVQNPMVIFGLVALIAAIYIWVERRRRMRQENI